MNNILQVKIKNVYGNERVYPVCEQSQLFAELTRTTTLTQHTIEIIKDLGYTIEVETPTL